MHFLKFLAKVALRREFICLPDIDVKTAVVGSEYGGWQVAPTLLSPESVVYSFGIGEDVSFDLELIDRFGLELHAFDPTPKSLQWIENQSLSPKFITHPIGLADHDGTVTFHAPPNDAHVSHSVFDRGHPEGKAVDVQVRTLAYIMHELGHLHIDLLKMDIEGSEYSVIKSLATTDIRPKQLLIEMHHRFKGIGIGESKSLIKQLRLMGYKLFYRSPKKEEFGFIHTSALTEATILTDAHSDS